MTEHWEWKKVNTAVRMGITCDRCEKRYDNELEAQEFLRWRDCGGYGNRAFGDGAHLALDLCQYCIKEVLGQWVKIEEPFGRQVVQHDEENSS